MMFEDISYAIAKIKVLKTHDLAFCFRDTGGIFRGMRETTRTSRTTYAAT
jgi:hypothetical protein